MYLDSTGFIAYELADDEREWLISEYRVEEFWLQRRPLLGKYGGYVRRDYITEDIEILPARSYHADRSHPLLFV